MKKIFYLVIVTILFAAGTAMISCNKDTACARAEDRCYECYEGTELNNCLSSVSVCKLALPGPTRDNCCKALAQCN